MKFRMKNIGAIENADVEIEGITIIAGENNVGKSTVGKALYAFLHDMDSWRNIYDEICSSRLENFLYQNSSLLEDWCMKITGAKRRRTSKAQQLMKRYAEDEGFRVSVEDYQLADDLDSKFGAKVVIERYLKEYSYEYLQLYAKDEISDLCEKHNDWICEWIQKALKSIEKIELDEIIIQKGRIEQSLNDVFGFQYRKSGTVESELEWIDDDGRSVIFSIYDKQTSLDIPVKAANRIFFVESPKLYDYLSDTAYGHVQKEYLRYLMSPNVFKKSRSFPKFFWKEYGVVNETATNVLNDIIERLVEVMGGRAEFLQKVGLEFKDNNISEPIHAVNVSTGLKSMALLEYALRIGAIEEGDILILDEPEINLHPEWQVEYARTLVHLQKMFNLKIIITTHSPYFMRAIECFSDVNDIMDKLNVYRVSKKKEIGRTIVENVSYSEFGMTDLYEDLSAPLEKLEELLDEKYGGHEHFLFFRQRTL